MVHRDIKPANIMYDQETGAIKVTDFGIARITDSSKTKTGMVLGTPSYMSPEQLAGQEVDGQSDLFSLGVTMYQLLSGQSAVPGRLHGAAHVQDRQRAAGRPVTLNQALPSAWWRSSIKALQKIRSSAIKSGRRWRGRFANAPVHSATWT